MLQCVTCGGVYAPTLADGTQYFHRCPPLSGVELAAAVAAGKVVLPGGETPAIAVNNRVYERNALRDENLPGTKATDSGKMIATGKGTTLAAAPSPVVVSVGP